MARETTPEGWNKWTRKDDAELKRIALGQQKDYTATETTGKFHPPSAPLSKARGHLEKETERGEHSPKVGGHKTNHGGQSSLNDLRAAIRRDAADNN